jgi:hypothetical protein
VFHSTCEHLRQHYAVLICHERPDDLSTIII